MEKISENKFWQEFISEFYTQDQVNQESYSCLNAVLECPEIIEMLNGCELSPEECKQYRAAILDVLNTKRSDLTKREDSIRQKLSDRNKKAEEYLLCLLYTSLLLWKKQSHFMERRINKEIRLLEKRQHLCLNLMRE